MGLYDGLLERIKASTAKNGTNDTAYNDAVRNIQTGIAGLQSSTATATTRNQEDYSSILNQLGKQNQENVKNIDASAANRGLGYSGLKVDAQGKSQEKYQTAIGDASSTKARADADINTSATNAVAGYNDSLSGAEENKGERDAVRGELEAQKAAESARVKAEADAQRIFMDDLKAQILQLSQPKASPTGQFQPPPANAPDHIVQAVQGVLENKQDIPANQVMPKTVTLSGPVNMQPSELQTLLKQAGFDPGPIDGRLGPKTAAALAQWKQANGLPFNGEVDLSVVEKLKSMMPPNTAGRGLKVGMM